MERLVHVLLVPGEVVAESENKGDLHYLRGLEADSEKPYPAAVVRALALVAQGGECQGDESQGYGNEDKPELHQPPVVEVGNDNGCGQSQKHGDKLGLPVAVADALICAYAAGCNGVDEQRSDNGTERYGEDQPEINAVLA